MDNQAPLHTANLIDELLVTHPTAIRLNALRLGLARDDEKISRSSLMQAVSEQKRSLNLTDKATAKLMYDLLSVETATKNLMQELASDTEGGQIKMYDLPNWAFYVVAFVFIVGIIATIGGLGRILQKITH